MPEVWETLLHWRCSQLPIFQILLPYSAPCLLAELPGGILLVVRGRERHDKDTPLVCVWKGKRSTSEWERGLSEISGLICIRALNHTGNVFFFPVFEYVCVCARALSCQRMWATSRSWKRQENRFAPRASEHKSNVTEPRSIETIHHRHHLEPPEETALMTPRF